MIDQDKPTTDETQGGKPRICKVLGVEVGERFTYPGMIGEFWVTESGMLRFEDDYGRDLKTCVPTLVNHPDRIIRKPRFTAEELEDIKAITRIYRPAIVGRLENGVPYISNREMSIMEAWGDDDRITYLPLRLFPSLEPGQSIRIQDIIDC